VVSAVPDLGALVTTDLRRAQALIAGARRIVVLTGAGMSAESGIPTFRQARAALWADFDPMQLASPEGFRADPPRVWSWYAWRREKVAGALPHAGYFALAAAAQCFEQMVLITQNVDGLHERAGSRNVIELHGNILRTTCFAQCGVRIDDPGALPPGVPPRCPRCGSHLRPDVVWFGEMLDAALLAQAERAASDCEVMLVVGTSALVYPAAGLPALAARSGAAIITINPEATEIDPIARICLRAAAAQALPQLFGGDNAV